MFRRRSTELTRLSGPANDVRRRRARKLFRKTEPYVHLTWEERRRAVLEVAETVSNWGFGRLFAECVDKSHFDPVRSHIRPPVRLDFPVQVTTINMGTVASAGYYIYLAGDRRLCVPGAVFGFHYSKDGIKGNSNIAMRDAFLDRTKLDRTVADTLIGGDGDVAVMKLVDWAEADFRDKPFVGQCANPSCTVWS